MNDIPPELTPAMITAALIAFGKVLKTYTPIKNDWIPPILLLIGTVLHMSTSGAWTMAAAWIQAFLFAAAATGIHQNIKSGEKFAKGEMQLVLVLLIPFFGLPFVAAWLLLATYC